MSEKELEKKPVKKKGRLAPILFGLLFLVDSESWLIQRFRISGILTGKAS